MKVALLGAGHIGQTIARLLHGSGDYRLTVIDRSADALARLALPGVATRVLGDAPGVAGNDAAAAEAALRSAIAGLYAAAPGAAAPGSAGSPAISNSSTP